MGRVQKTIAVISVIVILVLAAALGIFLWKESGGSRTLGKDQESDGLQEEIFGEQGLSGNTGTSGEQESSGNAGTSGEQEQSGNTGTSGEQESSGNAGNSGEADPSEEEPVITDVSMIFTGDVMLGSSVRSNYDSKGIRGILSEYLQQEMVQADITMVNQEFPFSTRGTPMPNKQYTFRADPSYLSAFHEMGIDVVSLANNHALDYGTDALLDTFAALDEAGIPYAGAGETKERAEQPIFLECGGRTVGILSASRVIPVVSWNIENRQPGLFCTYDSTALVAAIKEARKQCDYLLVYVHWGVERQAYPESYQRNLAQAYIDAGADLVVGSHPHVPQGIEYYQGKPIVYSLGNFIFNPNMAKTYVLKVVWDAAGESRLKVIPVAAVNTFTSQLEGQEAEEMLRYIESISYDVAIDGDGMVSNRRN